VPQWLTSRQTPFWTACMKSSASWAKNATETIFSCKQRLHYITLITGPLTVDSSCPQNSLWCVQWDVKPLHYYYRLTVVHLSAANMLFHLRDDYCREMNCERQLIPVCILSLFWMLHRTLLAVPLTAACRLTTDTRPSLLDTNAVCM